MKHGTEAEDEILALQEQVERDREQMESATTDEARAVYKAMLALSRQSLARAVAAAIRRAA